MIVSREVGGGPRAAEFEASQPAVGADHGGGQVVGELVAFRVVIQPQERADPGQFVGAGDGEGPGGLGPPEAGVGLQDGGRVVRRVEADREERDPAARSGWVGEPAGEVGELGVDRRAEVGQAGSGCR